ELEADVDRQPTLLAHVGIGEDGNRVLKTKMRDLPAIRVSREHKSARRRQPSRSQRRKVCRLWPDAIGIDGVSIGKRNEKAIHFQPFHTLNLRSVTLRWPSEARPSKGDGPGRSSFEGRARARPPQDDGISAVHASLHVIAIAGQRI